MKRRERTVIEWTASPTAVTEFLLRSAPQRPGVVPGC
jgi:hypothetical protein